MEINKITFEQLAKNAKVSENFEELDVNCDGKITKEDAELASINRIKNDIMSILNEADKDPIPMNQKASASTSSSIRGTSTTGLPLTDLNTFENDVLNSKGTVYVYVGSQNGVPQYAQNACKILASSVQEVANAYHLDTVNDDLVKSLKNEYGIKTNFDSDPFLLKFVDGKFVETVSLSGRDIENRLLEKVEGEPSEIPDIPPIIDPTTNSPKNKSAIKTTNTENFEKDVLNSKGTVYITLGREACGHCRSLDKIIEQNAQTINALASVYALNVDTDSDLCRKICKDMAGLDMSKVQSLPIVAKFVDGKFVQLIPNRYETDMAKDMIKLAQGTAKKDSDGIAQTSASTFEDDVKKSKGTTYVMITSDKGCGYCKKVHNAMAEVMSEVEDKFGFYELHTNKGADEKLCSQICKEMAGLDMSQGLPLPIIAKFVDGEFVEILTNNRGGNTGINNETIQEMIAKAEGTPINNTQTNYSNSFDQNVAQGKAAIPQIEKTKYLKEKELMETNLVKLQKELDTINEQRMLENQKLRKQENELKEKQEKIDELEMKIKKASTENIDTSQLSSELDALKQDAKTISASIRFLQSESNSLSSQYLSKLNSIQLQQQSIKGLEEKISAS